MLKRDKYLYKYLQIKGEDMATFTNKATLSYSGRTIDSNTVTGTITEALRVTKNALLGTYVQGGRLTYIVSIINSGNADVAGLTVEDDLGGYAFGGSTVYPLSYVEGSLAYYADGELQAPPTVVAGPPLSVQGIRVEANSNTTLIYQADVTEYAPLDVGSTITNTVTVVGLLGGDVTASETVETVDEAELTITKFLSPTNVTENGNLTYTFVIQNLGNTEAVATDDIVVRDVFEPILDITSVTLNGTPLAEGTGYTYDETTGEFETVASVITVPAATYTQLPDGSYTVTPGSVTLTVSGNI